MSDIYHLFCRRLWGFSDNGFRVSPGGSDIDDGARKGRDPEWPLGSKWRGLEYTLIALSRSYDPPIGDLGSTLPYAREGECFYLHLDDLWFVTGSELIV